MKSKVFLFSAFIILLSGTIYAQKILTLQDCYKNALSSNAISGEKDAYYSIWKIRDENLSKTWLPSIDANGTFVYNSSVVDISQVMGALPFPGIADAIKPLPHEQYKVTVDINQVIYDGGAVKSSKLLEKTDLDLNRKQTETDMYKLRSQINSYYFNLLLIDRQRKLLENYLEVIDKRIKTMKSALDNGMAIRSDIDIMTSEKIKLTQQINENSVIKASLLKVLSDITGSEIDGSAQFVLPVIPLEMNGELTRPELAMFDIRKEQLSAGQKLNQSKRMPKAFGFASLGYGNPPGNNFFKDQFAPYFTLGASVKWNIFDWNKTKNEKLITDMKETIIENRKSDLADNFKRLLESKNAEIENLRSTLNSDNELIAIRKRITQTAESQYENGTITATELLNEINSERQAVINHELHEINLSLAQVEYLNISGKELEK